MQVCPWVFRRLFRKKLCPILLLVCFGAGVFFARFQLPWVPKNYPEHEITGTLSQITTGAESLGNENTGGDREYIRMTRWVPAARAFEPGTKQKHPYLPGYVIENRRLCQGHSAAANASSDPVDIVLMIHSAARNFMRRLTLRETWARSHVLRGVKVTRIFLLGRGSASNSSGKGSPARLAANQMLINTEQAVYGDIVQGDFQDTPGNRTLKALTGLRWINDNCLHPQGSGVRFILKADDDMFVNVFALFEHFLQRLFSFATEQGGQDGTSAVMCQVRTMNVSDLLRQVKVTIPAKTRQSLERLFPPATSRTSCAGRLVVMTADAVPVLYRASFFAPYLYEDHVLVYGVLPVLAGEAERSGGGGGGNKAGEGRGDNFLRYLDINDSFVPNFERMLKRFATDGQPVKPGAVGSNLPPPPPPALWNYVTREGQIERLWHATLRTLSPWAMQRARIMSIRGVVPPGVL